MTATSTDRTSSRYWHERAAGAKPETRLFIGGKFVDASSGARFQTLNPATRQVLAEVAQGTAKDVDLAVAAAKKAFRSGRWSRIAPRARMDVLFKVARLLEQHADDLALLDCLDMGKPISELVNIDVPGSVMTWQYFAETIDKIEGAVTSTDPGALHLITREPLGVVGCVVPWKLPVDDGFLEGGAGAGGRQLGGAEARRTVPRSARCCWRSCLAEAGVPDGVFNVVKRLRRGRGPRAGPAHGREQIAFTGSTEVGKLMMVYAGQSNMKRVSTECGGKTAADHPARRGRPGRGGALRGQRHLRQPGRGLQRRLAPAGTGGAGRHLHRTLQEAGGRIVPAGRSARPPPPRWDPMVTQEQQKRVLGYIEAGQADGAKLAMGGAIPTGFQQGNYVSPTLFTRREVVDEDRPGGDLRPGGGGDPVQGRGRCDPHRQRFDLRAGRQHHGPRT